ncbi:hypothetical protein bAD24_I01975 [Burkholderia sp. AD24]|jgi:hypothetical protein|uniref:Uncharacterized protein n=1 Tax=Paraburkholderia bryophila TaxID=420952 RepID=A0A329CST0_9BURK|nr:hypothetical protein [Paraburkholderia bryophila]ASL42229.1 hypothetical protein bAD24_I01975 [Burkholderia sp. AD24]RAS37450.1 hypothetical protein BX591_103304 [Paraburkholderia bryophila]
MLSHHELATLMLFRDTERRIEPLDPDVLALRRYALVEVRQRQADETTLQLTRQGRELLARLQMGGKA